MFLRNILSDAKRIFFLNKRNFFTTTKNNNINKISNSLNLEKQKSINNLLFNKINYSCKNFSLKKLPNLKKYGESNIKNRKVNADIEKVISLYQQYMKKLDDINLMRRQLNEMKNFSKECAKSGKSVEQLSKDQKKHNQDIAKFQEELAEIENKLMTESLKIPNSTHPDSPVGDESKANILKVVGKKPEFDFQPLDHLEIGKKYD